MPSRTKQPEDHIAGETKRESLAAVARAMEIIEHLADAENGLSVSELSRRLGVNKSIAFRILGTLEAAGYLYKNEEDQRYRLTFKISNLGLRQLSNARFIEQCAPILRALAEQTGELVRLAAVDGGRPIWVHSAAGPRRRLQIDPVWGMDISLHSHAAGKAWLSTLEDEEIERVMGNEAMPGLTENTIQTMDELREDLRNVRERGFSISWEEHELGVSAVAAPITVDDRGKRICRGVVSVAAPTSRVSRAELREMGPLVVRTANQLGDIWPLDNEHAVQRLVAGG